jgi:alanine racemase
MPARLEIDTRAFRDNIAAVAARVAPGEMMLVTKDDAYGHGLEWAVREAHEAGVRWIGSYDVPSALRIRAALPDVRIFAWVTSSADEVAEAIRAGIDLGVGTAEYLRRVITEAERAARRAHVHLKIDTGLHRNGIRPEDWAETVADARRAEDAGLLRVAGVWSHLAEASDAEDDAAQGEFLSAVDVLRGAGGTPEHLHLTASAASWARPELRGTLNRIGAFCYGIRSADGPELDGIRPVASLRADVVDVSEDRVRIDIGALDGLPSNLVGAVLGGPNAPRIVHIDGTWTELALWAGATVGDSVTVFGADGPSATDLAERIDTVGEEILTRVSPLIPRRYS